MRGGMEYNIRPVGAEYTVQPLSVAHRANDNSQIQLVAVLAQKLLLDIVCIILINIQNNELFGLAFGNLPAQLAANRAAPAGHQHHPIPVKLQRFPVGDGERLAEQQILNLKFPHDTVLFAAVVHAHSVADRAVINFHLAAVRFISVI